MEETAGALNEVLAALTRLGVRHVIGGSLASGVRGVIRATADVDIVAAVRPDHAPRLVAELGPAWYGDADHIRRAIAARQSFNVIHIPTSSKVDIFPCSTAFHAAQLERASTCR